MAWQTMLLCRCIGGKWLPVTTCMLLEVFKVKTRNVASKSHDFMCHKFFDVTIVQCQNMNQIFIYDVVALTIAHFICNSQDSKLHTSCGIQLATFPSMYPSLGFCI
jgi:hypothetical protein